MTSSIIKKNMTEAQQRNLIETWLMNAGKLSHDDKHSTSGIELAKIMGFSLNEYHSKFIPMKKKCKKDLCMAIDGDLIIETFHDLTRDQLVKLQGMQDVINEDHEFFKEALKEVMEKPIGEFNDRDKIILKKFAQYIDSSNIRSNESFKAFASILEGFGKVTKGTEISATEERFSGREYVKETYKEKIYD